MEDGKGCTLDARRPSICRIYPFWVDDKENVIYEPGEAECFMEKKKISKEDALKLIGETESGIRSHFKKIKSDCVENKEQHEKLIRQLLRY